MDITRSTTQTLNALFTFLSQLQNTVVWVCSADYKKQLFLSDGFENIWGIPKEQLYNDIGIWMKTLYSDDIPIIFKALDKRNKEKQLCNVVNFRIQRPDNDIRCIKSTSYTIFNSEEKPAAIMGVDENLSREQWDQTKNISSSSYPLAKDLSEILYKEFKLILPTSEKIAKPNLMDITSPPKTIKVNNKYISLTDRESQCLVYLIHGRSAKETAYYLKLSTRTVETYLDKIRCKAKCRTKLALIGLLQQQSQSDIAW